MSRMTWSILIEMLEKRGFVSQTVQHYPLSAMPWYMIQSELEERMTEVYRILFGDNWKELWNEATLHNGSEYPDVTWAAGVYIRERQYPNGSLTKTL